MATHTNSIPVQTSAAATPAAEQQPITSGGHIIQRPTVNTSTDRTLKEGK
jgi:hypothetical protein